MIKAGEGRETARRLGRERLYFSRGFAVRSRALRARTSRLRRSCARLDKTAMLRRLERTSRRNRGAEGTSLSGPFSLSTAKATLTTRDRATGDWNQRHYDHFILSKTQSDFLVCRFPRRYIDQSLFQLCITARRIIVFRRTLFFVFVFF